MATFTIEFTVTERTRQRIIIEAETEDEAIELVESYEIDNSEAWQVASLEWSLDDVEPVA